MNLHEEPIKSKSRANQEPIKSKSIFSINFKSIFPIKISINIISRFCMKKILIEILILKFTFQINSWEDQNLDCNHYAMLRAAAQSSAWSFPLKAHFSTLSEKRERFICERILTILTNKPRRRASRCRGPSLCLRSWSGSIGFPNNEPDFTSSRKSDASWLSVQIQKNCWRLNANWYAEMQAIYSLFKTVWKSPWARGKIPRFGGQQHKIPNLQLATLLNGSSGKAQLPSVKRCKGPSRETVLSPQNA